MTPQRVALIHGERRFSYRDLDQRITCLAHGLAGRGIGRGDRVAFVGHNHPALLETLFACGLLGAVAVPVHPGFDEQARAQVLSDAAPAALIVGEPRHAEGSAIPLRFTTALNSELERYEDLVAAGSDEPIDRAIGLDDLCLVAFSSGTTGRNKGVRLTHGNLLFNALNTLSCADYRQGDVILTSAPLYRMGGLGFTLTVLLQGGCCVIQERPDPELSLRLIQRHRVSLLFDTVGALEQLEAAMSSADLSSLRVCLTGGSHISAALVKRFRDRGIALQPGYGLTEAAPLALVVDRDEVDAHLGASGRPPMFTAVRIVDAELEDVAPGDIGELLVSGPNVMPGYWRRPSADTRAFADGWLRTGDAARASSDGMITIVGRLADALRLDGKLVHPTPIEDALRDLGARDCALVQTAPEALPRLFVVLPNEGEPGELLAHCRAALGVTPTLHEVRSLPKNANGKVLRRRLSRADTARLDAMRSFSVAVGAGGEPAVRALSWTDIADGEATRETL